MQPPKIDTRDLNALINQMKQMAPHYTPEWRFTPDQPDPGSALFMIAADMLLENIHRLNQVPLNHLIAYLNLFDISLLSAKPSRTYLTFTLSEGARDPVLIPEGAQASAPGGEEDLLFETEKPLLVTAAKPLHAICTNGELDQILHVASNLHEQAISGQFIPFPAFPGRSEDNRQQHHFYIGHSEVCRVVHPAIVKLEFSNEERRFKLNDSVSQLVMADVVAWEYCHNGNWLAFDQAAAEENRIILHKNNDLEITETEVGGLVTRWIRASIKPDQIDQLPVAGELPEIDGIVMQSAYAGGITEGFMPDRMFHDDLELKKDGCYPFGEFFVPQTCFYVSSKEAFSKRGGLVSIQLRLDFIPNQMSKPKPKEINWKLIMKKNAFDEPEIPRASIMKANWEYWNGRSWVRLFTGDEYETLFSNTYEDQITVVFHCPSDMEETTVNSELNYWIRVRVLKIEHLYEADPIYMSPWIEDVRLAYEYGDRYITAEQCVTDNSMELKDRRGQIASTTRKAFYPFEPLENRKPVWYIGFDSPPLKGPISLYMALDQAGVYPRYRNVRFEYLRKKGGQFDWTEMKVDDGTDSLRRSGTVQFVGSRDHSSRAQFGVNAYWIRIVLEGEAEGSAPPIVKGMYMNTVAAVQQDTVRGETPELVNLASFEFRLSRSPVRSEEIWIDETGALTEEQVSRLQQQYPADVEVVRDSEGMTQKVWIKWKAADSISITAGTDRYYTIDRNSGIFTFDSGSSPRLPVSFGTDKMKAHYKQIRGSEGNIPARRIVNMQSSFAFVDAVFNPDPAVGGSDSETLTEAFQRGPQIVRHRGRAVTANDYEWLAKEASLQVAKTKCLPNTNEKLEKENGSIAIVVYPKDGHRNPQLFLEVKKQVEAYLSERTSNTLLQAGKVHLVPPAYAEITVNAELIVTSMQSVLAIEQQSMRRLNQFLDPMRGNYDGKGWTIGGSIHISSFYALLKSIPQVSHIAKLTMDAVKIENGIRTEISPADIGTLVHGLIVGGEHRISIRT